MPIPRRSFIARMDQQAEHRSTGNSADSSNYVDALSRSDSEKLTHLGKAVEVKTSNKGTVPAVVERAAAMKANDPNSFSDKNQNMSMEELVDDSKKKLNKSKKLFTEKLMEVLTLDETSHAITWLPNGKMFQVVNPTKLVEDVLPCFFQQTKFESFDRKLRRWGFKRVVRGSIALIYHHPMFLRDEPEKCKLMRSTYIESLERSTAEPQSAKLKNVDTTSRRRRHSSATILASSGTVSHGRRRSSASAVSHGRRRSSATISVGVSEMQLDYKEIEETEEKLSAQCINKKMSPLTENSSDCLQKEQDQIVSNAEIKNVFEHQRLLYIQNQSRTLIDNLEAQNAALRKEILEQCPRQMSLTSKYASHPLQNRATTTVAMQTQNTALPSILHDRKPESHVVPHLSSPFSPNELATYFNRKMSTIYAQYSNVLHPVSHEVATSAQKPSVLLSQRPTEDCAMLPFNIHRKNALKRSSNESSELSDIPKSNHANTA